MIKPEAAQPGQSAADSRLAVSRGTSLRYRRSQVFGLLLIAGVILVVTLLRADPRALFPPGWWR